MRSYAGSDVKLPGSDVKLPGSDVKLPGYDVKLLPGGDEKLRWK
jgi:hypothetical protein